MTKTRTWLIVILLLAVLLRAGVAPYLGDTVPAGNDEQSYSELAARLAVEEPAHQEIARDAGSAFDGKIVVDVSNALTPSMELALGFTTSAPEELQKLIPREKVVKAFNTVFAQNMRTGRVHGEPLSAFLAGDDAGSKEKVRTIAEDIGFDSIDTGPLRTARYLEPLGMLNIGLGYGLKMGTDIGIAMIRKERAALRRAA